LIPSLYQENVANMTLVTEQSFVLRPCLYAKCSNPLFLGYTAGQAHLDREGQRPGGQVAGRAGDPDAAQLEAAG
jgi:hypothetical protein